jgi:predicted transcriptional regulator
MSPRRRHPLPRLGELELAVLEHLWDAGETDVNQAHGALGRHRGITANTVGSALERLFRKKLVMRTKVSHCYRYRASETREAFAARRMLDAVGGSGTLADSGLLAAFVDLVAGEDRASLDRLAQLIASKRDEQDQR